MIRRAALLAALVLAPAAAVAATAATAPDPTLLNALADLSPARLEHFVGRPLFAPNRRPPAPAPVEPEEIEAPVDEVDEPPAAPNIRLSGVLVAGDDRIAVVRDLDANAAMTLRLGDAVGDWSVSAIGEVAITLTLGDQTVGFGLFAPRSGDASDEPAPDEAAPDEAGAAAGDEGDVTGEVTEPPPDEGPLHGDGPAPERHGRAVRSPPARP